MTPEGRVKVKVSAILKSTRDLYYEMPVPGGFGVSGLDYTGCHKGAFFAIETKAPGNTPTERQMYVIRAMRSAGATVFVIAGTDERDLLPLIAWLARNTSVPA